VKPNNFKKENAIISNFQRQNGQGYHINTVEKWMFLYSDHKNMVVTAAEL
jgi:hypothetical protein